MLKIRMQRIGKINQPSFRIIVVEHTEGPKTGRFVDRVGTYNPKTKERTLDEAKIRHWISVGAKASPTVHNMLISLGIVQGKKINVLPAYKEPVREKVALGAETKEEASVGEAKTEKKALEAVETPAAPAPKEDMKEETPAQA